MNQILNVLPKCYRDNGNQQQIADSLTSGLDDVFTNLVNKLNNYSQNYLDPATCDPAWLDTLASYSGWQQYWDSTQPVNIKRLLLINTELLWQNRGNRDVLPILFGIYGLDATLAASTGFILKQSTLPGYLNYDPFTYTISIPRIYTTASPQYKLILRLIKQFTPCWIQFVFTFYN